MSVCEDCGQRLQQFRLFSQACPACGARYRVRAGQSAAAVLPGALFPLLVVLALFSPGPGWIPLIAVPGLIVGGVVAALAMQRWVKVDGSASCPVSRPCSGHRR